MSIIWNPDKALGALDSAVVPSKRAKTDSSQNIFHSTRAFGVKQRAQLLKGVKTVMKARFPVALDPIAFLFLVLPLASSLQGCLVSSVFPLSEDSRDIIFDPELVGTWRQPDHGCTLEVRKADRNDNSYDVEYSALPEKQGDGCEIGPGKSINFGGYLVQIGRHRFADLEPTDDCSCDDHIFYKLDRDGDSLSAVPFDVDWIEEQLDRKKARIEGRVDAGTMYPDTVLLTSKPEKLRALMRTAADDPHAFPDDLQFHFVRETRPQQPSEDGLERKNPQE